MKSKGKTSENGVFRQIQKLFALGLCLALLSFGVPSTSFANQETESLFQASQGTTTTLPDQNSVIEEVQNQMEAFFLNSPLSESQEEKVEVSESTPNELGYARVDLDYAMSQSGEGVAILEVIDVASLSPKSLKEFRSGDVEHALFLIDAGATVELVYVSSGDEFHIRTHEALQPLFENAIFASHNHPNGQSNPGETDFAESLTEPFWEVVGTERDLWTSYSKEGVLDQSLSDELIFETITTYASSDWSDELELAGLRSDLHDILIEFESLQNKQRELSETNEGVLTRSAPHVLINQGNTITNDAQIELTIGDAFPQATQIRVAINSTSESSYGGLMTLTTPLSVNLPEFFGTNYVNVRFFDDLGNEVGYLWDSIQYVKPSLSINSDAVLTNEKNLAISFQNVAEDVTHVRFAINSTAPEDYGNLISYTSPMSITIPSYEGLNFVNVKFYDSEGNQVAYQFDSIEFRHPAFQINSGATSTTSRLVDLDFQYLSPEVTHYSYSTNSTELNHFSGLTSLSENIQVMLPTYFGDNYVNVRFHDATGKVIRWAWQKIELKRDTFTINLPPSASEIISDAEDEDGTASGTQISADRLVTYSVTVNDPDQDTLSWQWRYRINGGDAVVYASGTGGLTEIQVDYSLLEGASAGDSISWTFSVSDGQAFVGRFYTVHLIEPPLQQGPEIVPILDQTIAANAAGDSTLVIRPEITDPSGTGYSFQVSVLDVNSGATFLLEDLGGWSEVGILNSIVWSPVVEQMGLYDFTLIVTDGNGQVSTETFRVEVLEPPICEGGIQEVCDYLLSLEAQGLASGNLGEFYHNRDNDHAVAYLGDTPQLSILDLDGVTAELNVHTGKVVFGNSSTAFEEGDSWGSSTRVQLMDSQQSADAAYQQYINNNHYFYPEHTDHDLVDYFHAKFPYAFVSQGSSATELDEVRNFLYASAALKPEVKQALINSGLLIPTLEMLSRRSRVADNATYLTGAAHPSAFGNHPNPLLMAQMAQAMTLSDIPPMVQLEVIEDNYDGILGVDYFEESGKAEGNFETPASISKIYRGRENVKRMVVSAENSYDLAGNPLTYEWKVLRGGAQKVTINPLNAEGSLVEILIEYHPKADIESDPARQSNLVEVGAFVSNGTYYSAPGFVTSYSLDNEHRVYDAEGKLMAQIHNDSYVHPMLSTQKSWDRDDFHYDANGELLGWTRTSGVSTAEYTADGHLVTETDVLGRPTRAKAVSYQEVNGLLEMTEDPFTMVIYSYADNSDLRGWVDRVETNNFFGQTIATVQYEYLPNGDYSHAELFNILGEPVADLKQLAGNVLSLSAPGTTEPSIKIKGARGFENAVYLALTGGSYFTQLLKASEMLAVTEPRGEFMIDFSFLGLIPSNPDNGYLGDLSVAFNNTYTGQTSFVDIWTTRTFGWEYDFAGTSGFSLSVQGEGPRTQTHYNSSGIELGIFSLDYENQKRLEALVETRLAEDLPLLDLGTVTIEVFDDTIDASDNFHANATVKGSYRVEVKDSNGLVLKEYSVSELSIFPYSNTNEFYGIFDSSNDSEKYVYGWGYPNGFVYTAYTLLDEELTCLVSGICSSWS